MRGGGRGRDSGLGRVVVRLELELRPCSGRYTFDIENMGDIGNTKL